MASAARLCFRRELGWTLIVRGPATRSYPKIETGCGKRMPCYRPDRPSLKIVQRLFFGGASFATKMHTMDHL